MKQNDIAAIVLIVAVSGVFSFFVANTLIGNPENNPVQVESVVPINDSFPTPDNRVFNDKSIDATVEIQGGDTGSDSVFDN
jgi:hypothetical protein